MRHYCAYMYIRLTPEQVEFKKCRAKFGKRKCNYYYCIEEENHGEEDMPDALIRHLT